MEAVLYRYTGWRLFGIFAATIAGLILQPVPGGALVLLAVTMALVGGLPIEQALAGYSNSWVWLALAAFFNSRAHQYRAGTADRAVLVRLFEKSSVGISYSDLAESEAWERLRIGNTVEIRAYERS